MLNYILFNYSIYLFAHIEEDKIHIGKKEIETQEVVQGGGGVVLYPLLQHFLKCYNKHASSEV